MRLVKEFQTSGEKVGSYAKSQGISEWTLRRWVTEANRLERPEMGAGLVPVRVKAGGMEGERIEVEFAEGTILRVPAAMGAEKLGALVAAVRRRC
jgi:hypothetical protein